MTSLPEWADACRTDVAVTAATHGLGNRAHKPPNH